MKLGPLPPKPPLLPPLWWLAPLAAILSLIALCANAKSAYDFARAGNDGWVAFHCALMAWMLIAFVYDVSRAIESFLDWRELRRSWDRLHALREKLQRWKNCE